MKFNPPLFALAAGAFGIGVTEFAPMGLLPVIAGDLGVTIPTAGLLISALCGRRPAGGTADDDHHRPDPAAQPAHRLTAIFTIGNLLAALSTSYEMLLVARLITALNHGAFFGVGSVVAARLVPENRRAAAVAAMFMGLTIANVVGVPLATWGGDLIGWRAAFFGIAALGVVAMAALRLTLPDIAVEIGGDMLLN